MSTPDEPLPGQPDETTEEPSPPDVQLLQPAPPQSEGALA